MLGGLQKSAGSSERRAVQEEVLVKWVNECGGKSVERRLTSACLPLTFQHFSFISASDETAKGGRWTLSCLRSTHQTINCRWRDREKKDEADWMKINLLKEGKKMPCVFSWASKRILYRFHDWRITSGENTYSSTRCCVMQKALHLQWTNIAFWIMESRKARTHENIHDSKKIAFLAKNCISWFLIRLSGTRAFSFTAFGCDSASEAVCKKCSFDRRLHSHAIVKRKAFVLIPHKALLRAGCTWMASLAFRRMT